MRRNSSTIPFGYKLASDDKTLVPVAKEIESLINVFARSAIAFIRSAEPTDVPPNFCTTIFLFTFIINSVL